eukprot:4571254-Prorocentrum_lima.AAC.1
MLTNHEVIVRNTKFYSTVHRKNLLLRDFEPCLPHLLVGYMPTLPALPPKRSHALQVELICHMMKIMQEQGGAVVVLLRDSRCHEQQE